MSEILVATVFDAGPAAVYDFLADPRNTPAYIDTVRTVDVLPDGPQSGVGQRAVLRGAVEIGPFRRRYESHWEVVTAVRPTELGLRSDGREFRLDLEMSVRPADVGAEVETRVRWQVRRLGVLARYADGFLEGQVRIGMDRARAALAARMTGAADG